jgi:hypothetical protein
VRAMLLAVLVLIVCFTCPVQARAQEGARLWAELAPQWSHRYSVKAKLELEQQRAGEVLEQEAVLRLAVVSVAGAGQGEGGGGEGDGNNSRSVLRASIEKLTIRHTSAGETLRFDWPEAQQPRQPQGAQSASLARIGRALAESVLEFEVGTDGRATLTAGLETALLAAEQAEQAREGSTPVRFLGVFTPGAADRMITSIITLDEDRQPRTVGRQWQSAFPARALGREAQIITELTLRSMEETVAMVGGDIKVVLGRPDREAPHLPRATMPEHTGTITARWDVGTRRLLHHLWETRTVWETALAVEPPIVSRTTNTARIELNLLLDPLERP